MRKSVHNRPLEAELLFFSLKEGASEQIFSNILAPSTFFGVCSILLEKSCILIAAEISK